MKCYYHNCSCLKKYLSNCDVFNIKEGELCPCLVLFARALKNRKASKYLKVQLTNLVVNDIQIHDEKFPLNCPARQADELTVFK